MIKLIVKFVVKEDKINDFLEVCKKLADNTRTEKGCDHYDVYKLTKADNMFIMDEAWETQADLDNHMSTDIFNSLIPQLNETLKEEIYSDAYSQVV